MAAVTIKPRRDGTYEVINEEGKLLDGGRWYVSETEPGFVTIAPCLYVQLPIRVPADWVKAISEMPPPPPTSVIPDGARVLVTAQSVHNGETGTIVPRSNLHKTAGFWECAVDIDGIPYGFNASELEIL